MCVNKFCCKKKIGKKKIELKIIINYQKIGYLIYFVINLIMTSIETLDVQEELQNYLTSKKVNALFISIIEVLLLEKPDNPIKFIIEYLKQECK